MTCQSSIRGNLPHDTPADRRLAETITLAIEDCQLRQRAAALGRQLHAKDGLTAAVEVIERTVRHG